MALGIELFDWVNLQSTGAKGTDRVDPLDLRGNWVQVGWSGIITHTCHYTFTLIDLLTLLGAM